MKSTDSQIILDSIRRVVQALRLSSRAAEKNLNLSGAQLFVMEKLRVGGPLSINELAQKTLTHQSSVSVVITRLVEKGLVHRQPSKSDGRKLELILAKEGHALLRKNPKTVQELLVKAIEELSFRKRREFASTFLSILNTSGLNSYEPELFFEEPMKNHEKSR